MRDEQRKLLPEFKDFGTWLAAYKPAGLSTHSPEGTRGLGLAEWLETQLGHPLWVVHRLDKATSGLMLFAKDKATAEVFFDLFSSHLIQKTYVFLTRGKCAEEAFTVQSHIEKDGSAFVSHERLPANSETHFRKLKSSGVFTLWQARPRTGKPHQIRLHAASRGLAICGDEDHGGSYFPCLALHAQELLISEDTARRLGASAEIRLQSPAPAWLQEAFWTTPENDQRLQLSLQRRRWLFSPGHAPSEMLRLVHDETGSYRLDRFGTQAWVYWYDETRAPNEDDIAALRKNLALAGVERFLLRTMHNRGASPLKSEDDIVHGDLQTEWTAEENGVRFELRADLGLSPGLFLDQRENRLWVKQQARDKRVLNLFAYTGGFSVNAAVGGAREVCTVDLSKRLIQHARRNFQLNGLEDQNYEFWAQDVFLFIKGAVKRGRRFDLIICDPPSFSRNGKEVFRIEKDLPGLLEPLSELLAPGGEILFCTNYEKWSVQDFDKKLQLLLPAPKWTLLSSHGAGLDYELPEKSL